MNLLHLSTRRSLTVAINNQLISLSHMRGLCFLFVCFHGFFPLFLQAQSPLELDRLAFSKLLESQQIMFLSTSGSIITDLIYPEWEKRKNDTEDMSNIRSFTCSQFYSLPVKRKLHVLHFPELYFIKEDEIADAKIKNSRQNRQELPTEYEQTIFQDTLQYETIE